MPLHPGNQTPGRAPGIAAVLPAPPPIAVSTRNTHHEAAEGQTQEGDVQRQEGAEAGNAGGQAADRHHRAAHAGCGGAPHRALCLRGHAARRH